MERLPLLCRGMNVGELTVEGLPGEVRFSTRCPGDGKELQSLWVVGNRGELRLGVMEEAFSRCFSRRMTAPLGPLLRGELRKVGEDRGVEWQQVMHPEELFRTPWLRRALMGVEGALTKMEAGRRVLALPYSARRPFPLVPIFCFCSIRNIAQRDYAVFVLDEKEWPLVF